MCLLLTSAGSGCSDRVTPLQVDRMDAESGTAAEQDAAAESDASRPGVVVEAVTFADVHAILVEHCGGSDCHSRTDVPRPGFAVAERAEAYEQTEGWTRRMVEVIESGFMPLGRGCGTGNELRDPPPEGCLSRSERERVGNWVAQGAVE